MNNHINRTIVLPDIHYPEHDTAALECALEIMTTYKPHTIILLGDALNMTPLSHWIENKRRALENQRLLKDYKSFNNLLKEMKNRAGTQLREIIYIQGNHEDWINQYIDANPEVEGLIELDQHIKLRGVPIQFIQLNKFYKLGKLYLTHGLYTNQYHASKTVAMTGKSVMYGHSHDVQVHTKVGIVNDNKHQAFCIGCLCSKAPGYMRNNPNNWMHAFATVDTLPNGYFSTQIINIIEGKTIYRDKVYDGKRLYAKHKKEYK